MGPQKAKAPPSARKVGQTHGPDTWWGGPLPPSAILQAPSRRPGVWGGADSLLSLFTSPTPDPFPEETPPSRVFTVTPLSWTWVPSIFKSCTEHPAHRKTQLVSSLRSGLLINEGEGLCWLRGCQAAGKVPRHLFETLPGLESSLRLLGKDTLPPSLGAWKSGSWGDRVTGAAT